MKKAGVIICLILMTGALTMVAAACRPSTNDPEYTFDNYKLPVAQIDAEMTVDGVLDESVWQNVEWLELNYTDASISVNLYMTSYFGEKGCYFAFKCDDPMLYATNRRPGYNNSGIEFYLAPHTANNIEDTTFEIDLNVNGKMEVRKHFHGSYGKWNAPYELMPIFGVKVLGGSINSDKACDGYEMEFYMPYESLGISEKPDIIYSTPTIIRTYSAQASDYDRLRHAFGPEKLPGYASNNPQSWWRFTESGIFTYATQFSVTGGGNVRAADAAIPMRAMTFLIEPDDGYSLSSLDVNGKNVTADIECDSKGNAIYRIVPNKDMQITAVFAAISGQGHTGSISGKLKTRSGTDFSAAALDMMKVYALKDGIVYSLTTAEDSTYSGQLPYGTGYSLYVFDKDGGVQLYYKSDINIIASTQVLDIDLSMEANKFKLIEASGDRPNYGATVFQASGSNDSDSVVNLLFGYANPNILNSDGTINRNSDEVLNNMNFGCKIYLTDKTSFKFEIINWASGLWRIKINNINTTSGELLTAEQLRLLIDNNLLITMTKSGSDYAFYIDDGTGAMVQFYSMTFGTADTAISKVDFNTFSQLEGVTSSLRGSIYYGSSDQTVCLL